MSQENVELIGSLIPDTPNDLVQVFREDPQRGAVARAAFEPRFHPDFECIRHDLPGSQPHFCFVPGTLWYRSGDTILIGWLSAPSDRSQFNALVEAL